MMRNAIKYLRYKQSKSLPKKGTPEYAELQKRLIERKMKTPDKAVDQVVIPEKTPKSFKYVLTMSAFPPTIGMYTMFTSDYASELYASSLALTGTWIGTTSVLLSAYLTGLEAFYYQVPYYTHSTNYLFTGARRIAFSMMGMPMGFLCLYSTVTSNWVGFFFYFSWLLLNTLTTIRSCEKKIIPGWLGNSHWPWLIQTQLIVVFITYSLFTKECRAISN